MSLDIILRTAEGDSVYEANITHNLTTMADALGMYQAIWRPEEIGIERAGQVIPYLEKGISEMAIYREKYMQYEAENGWGTYAVFLPWLQDYLHACRKYPLSSIEISR